MSWSKFFCCFSRCRGSSRVSHDVTAGPRGPQPMRPLAAISVPVSLENIRSLEDIELEMKLGDELEGFTL